MRKLWLFFPVLLLSACIGTSRPARFYNLQAENIGAYSNAAPLPSGTERLLFC